VFLAALIITGIYVQIPAMIPIAIILLGIELALHMAPTYTPKVLAHIVHFWGSRVFL
jgi:hypothetical protein